MDAWSYDHRQARNYFTESIKERGCQFKARQCDSWEKYKSKECCNKPEEPMGIDATPPTNESVTMKLYLRTNGVAPFCKAESADCSPRRADHHMVDNHREDDNHEDGSEYEYEFGDEYRGNDYPGDDYRKSDYPGYDYYEEYHNNDLTWPGFGR